MDLSKDFLYQGATAEDREKEYSKQKSQIAAVSEDGYAKTIAKRFFSDKLATFSFIVFILIVLVAIFAPYIAPYNPNEIVGAFQQAPSKEHLLGTDQVGRDCLSRLIYGSRVSLIVGIGSTLISTIIGITTGLLAGYFGGVLDMIIMRITDAVSAFPYFLVVLTVVSILESGIVTVTVIMGLLGWPRLTRIVRGQVLSVKSQDYVLAAKATGYSSFSILFNEILPNLLSPILVFFTFNIANSIMTEASLSFLGVGVRPPTASWGNILSESQALNVLTSQPWRWIPAGLMILITVLVINFIGDRLRRSIEGETRN